MFIFWSFLIQVKTLFQGMSKREGLEWIVLELRMLLISLQISVRNVKKKNKMLILMIKSLDEFIWIKLTLTFFAT